MDRERDSSSYCRPTQSRSCDHPAENAKTIRDGGRKTSSSRLILRLVDAGGFTLSDEGAGNAIRDAANAIRGSGRMPRFEAAEKIATTDDRDFVVAIVRQASTPATRRPSWGNMERAKDGGSLSDAANWLYDQVGFGQWNEPPPVLSRSSPSPPRFVRWSGERTSY